MNFENIDYPSENNDENELSKITITEKGVMEEGDVTSLSDILRQRYDDPLKEEHIFNKIKNINEIINDLPEAEQPEFRKKYLII